MLRSKIKVGNLVWIKTTLGNRDKEQFGVILQIEPSKATLVYLVNDMTIDYLFKHEIREVCA